ncbi:response regulator [Mastigocladopsis repens]|uniref:response regulator n=1 Tax=Mastigocladopsis repens TaxID=221287 RepID=UPI0003165910|nr:response regulator [Mastigocladopsis repens]
MQGNLNEIDIRSILQLIELGQRTGLLFVEAYSYHNSYKVRVRDAECKQQSWFVFFFNGQIVYATNDDTSLSRLDDYLRYYRVNVQLNEMQVASGGLLNAPEYGYLWALLEQNIIKPAQARSIIYNFVHETLFDILSLHQGRFIFELGSALTPQLTTLEIAPLVIKITKQVQEWKQLYPLIQSPEQFPLLADIDQLRSSLPAATVKKLQHWADGNTSLRQLARYLNRDILTVAKTIYPYVKQGWLKFKYKNLINLSKNTEKLAEELERNHRAYIVCIDDITICEIVETILKPQRYEVIALTNSLEALSRIFQLKPNLILCNIAMAEVDGYEICAMLRHSTAFRLVPIILLTGRLRFVEQTKARILGATDYLTKPFTDTELLMLVNRYINYSVVSGDKRETTLVDSTKNGVKNNITEIASLSIRNII